jgi:hypothetical protein
MTSAKNAAALELRVTARRGTCLDKASLRVIGQKDTYLEMTLRSLPIARRSRGAGAPFRGTTGAFPWGRWIATGVLVLACGAGCIRPKDDYEEFAKRPLTEREASVVDVQLTPCEELLKENLSGDFLVSCRPNALRDSPFGLAVRQKVTPSPDGKTATLGLAFTPLKIGAKNFSDTTGTLTTLSDAALTTECSYRLDIGTLTLGKEANILDLDLQATNVVLRGKLQTVDRACAELDGEVTLIGLSLQNDMDYCIFKRVAADGVLPVVGADDYACDPAGLPPR